MMTPRESMEEILGLLERALVEPDLRDARGYLIQAQTHAVIQVAGLRRAEARSELAAHLEHGGAVQ